MEVKLPPPIAKCPGSLQPWTYNVLYLYAGAERKSSIRTEAEVLCKDLPLTIVVTEWDLLQGGDLLDNTTWEVLEGQLEDGLFDAILASPPCETHTRSLFSGRPGPPPLRSADFPDGFPWLRGAHREPGS